MKKIILGFAGEMGCGKDAAAEYIFSKYGGKKFKFSSSLRDILDRIYQEKSRENLSILSTGLRESFGQDILAKIMYRDILQSEENIILIDGVRRKDDLVHIEDLPEFKLIYVDVSLENRFNRINKRGENSDDIGKTMEQFQKDQLLETEIHIRGLRDISDYIIDNNSDLSSFYSQIDRIIMELR